MGRLFFGRDIRALGSGNAGGTNALRVFGWRAALPVMAVDVGKGALAALLPRALAVGDPAWLAVACAAAAVIGHVLPVLAGFRGGKGVATGAGAFLVLAPWAALACGVVWVLVVALTRIVSLASLVAALALPAAVALLAGHRVPWLLPVSAALAGLVMWTHRSNLRRLAHGEEARITVGRPTAGT